MFLHKKNGKLKSEQREVIERVKEMLMKAAEIDDEREAVLWLSIISCLGAGYLIFFLIKKMFETLDVTTETNKKLVEIAHVRVEGVEKVVRESNAKLDELLRR